MIHQAISNYNCCSVAVSLPASAAFTEKSWLAVYWLTRRWCGDGCRGNKSDAANKRRNSSLRAMSNDFLRECSASKK